MRMMYHFIGRIRFLVFFVLSFFIVKVIKFIVDN